MSELHAETVPFVRGTMLPEAPPPAAERGAIHWLRANLFSGWVNTILTFVGLFVLWWLFQHFYPWFRHSVWNASSIGECRQIIAERYGQGAGGACFAIIRERWNQFLFGFYPPAEYWRPISAFWLLFLALAPVLEHVGTLQGLTSATAGPLLEDREGNLWVGTNLGLNRFRHRALLPLAALLPGPATAVEMFTSRSGAAPGRSAAWTTSPPARWPARPPGRPAAPARCRPHPA